MTSSQPLALPGYAHVYSGKVRDLYAPIDPATGEPRTTSCCSSPATASRPTTTCSGPPSPTRAQC